MGAKCRRKQAQVSRYPVTDRVARCAGFPSSGTHHMCHAWPSGEAHLRLESSQGFHLRSVMDTCNACVTCLSSSDASPLEQNRQLMPTMLSMVTVQLNQGHTGSCLTQAYKALLSGRIFQEFNSSLKGQPRTSPQGRLRWGSVELEQTSRISPFPHTTFFFPYYCDVDFVKCCISCVVPCCVMCITLLSVRSPLPSAASCVLRLFR